MCLNVPRIIIIINNDLIPSRKYASTRTPICSNREICDGVEMTEKVCQQEIEFSSTHLYKNMILVKAEGHLQKCISTVLRQFIYFFRN